MNPETVPPSIQYNNQTFETGPLRLTERAWNKLRRFTRLIAAWTWNGVNRASRITFYYMGKITCKVCSEWIFDKVLCMAEWSWEQVMWIARWTWDKATVTVFAEYTVDSRYLEPSREIEKRFELSGVRVIGSSKKIAESKVKNSFYCIVNILITFNCRNVK